MHAATASSIVPCFPRSSSDANSRPSTSPTWRTSVTTAGSACACQFAPPHEFGINVPMVLSEVRARSYEGYAWPPPLGRAFASHSFRTSLAALGLVVSMLLLVSMARPEVVWSSDGSADFYGVIPHAAMVGLFGTVSLFVLISLGISGWRFWRDVRQSAGAASGSLRDAVRDALTLRHLHGAGRDCTSNLEMRLPWRRWFHHCTFYGFLLCMASTTVAAIYHSVFGVRTLFVLERAGPARRCWWLWGSSDRWVLLRFARPATHWPWKAEVSILYFLVCSFSQA